jgi:formylglycine-generating enzyme required for sulfatase activity
VTPTSAVTTGGGFEDLSLDVSDALKEQGCADDARAKGQVARSARLAAAVKAAQSEASVAWSKLGPQAEACLELRDASLREGCAKTVEAYVTRASSLKVSLAAGTEDAETACGVRRAVYPAETVAVAVGELPTAKGLAAKLRGAVSSGASSGGSAGSAWTSPTLGTMRWIPAGSFTMGSPASESGRDDDEVQHRVTLTKGFWMMEHEVTQGEWAAVMGSNPSGFSSCGARCPVENVSWEDALVFAKRVSARDGVSYRLPTEAEWEYAARGGASHVYAGSGELGEVGWYTDNSGSKTHAVCGKARNGYGLCDMSGNAWEWVADWYGAYPTGSVTDPTGAAAGSDRVNRGGGWNNPARLARAANRDWYAPSIRRNNLGFRLVRSGP